MTITAPARTSHRPGPPQEPAPQAAFFVRERSASPRHAVQANVRRRKENSRESQDPRELKIRTTSLSG